MIVVFSLATGNLENHSNSTVRRAHRSGVEGHVRKGYFKVPYNLYFKLEKADFATILIY